MKVCVACKEAKSLSEFYRDRPRKDGLSPYCKPCVKIKQAGRSKRKGNYKAGQKEYMRQWRAANKDKIRENDKKWREANPEKVKAWAKRRYRKDEAIARAKKWKARNPGAVNANTASRRAQKKSATPQWADPKAIEAIYKEARRLSEETGTPHEVDHIIPLQHELVCGLHVPENLQILSRSENAKKSNTFSIQ